MVELVTRHGGSTTEQQCWEWVGRLDTVCRQGKDWSHFGWKIAMPQLQLVEHAVPGIDKWLWWLVKRVLRTRFIQ